MDGAEERVALDVFGVVGKDNMTCTGNIAYAPSAWVTVAQDPVIFAVALGGEAVGALLEEARYEVDCVAGDGCEGDAINVWSGIALIRGEAQAALVVLR